MHSISTHRTANLAPSSLDTPVRCFFFRQDSIYAWCIYQIFGRSVTREGRKGSECRSGRQTPWPRRKAAHAQQVMTDCYGHCRQTEWKKWQANRNIRHIPIVPISEPLQCNWINLYHIYYQSLRHALTHVPDPDCSQCIKVFQRFWHLHDLYLVAAFVWQVYEWNKFKNGVSSVADAPRLGQTHSLKVASTPAAAIGTRYLTAT